MDEMKDVFLRLVKAGLETKKLQEAYANAGIDDNMLMDVYGNILEAIYALLGEHTEEFADSVTHIVMTAPILSDERRAKMLYAEFKKNNCQPSPNVIEPAEMRKMFKANGGFMTPEGDWS